MLFPLFICLIFVFAPAAVIAQNGPGPGVFALRTMLQDKDPEIRIKAAEGLGRVGGRQSDVILRQGLGDKESSVQVAVVQALGFKALPPFQVVPVGGVILDVPVRTKSSP